jgi:hypothetical protein
VIRRLHHVGILTHDLDAMLAHYLELLAVDRPGITEIERPGLRLRTTMVATGPGADTPFLQLIEPHVGPGVMELADGGEGALFEIAFEVVGLAELTETLADRGIRPEDFSGRPIAGPFAMASSGNHYAYLPSSLTRGTRTELIEPVSPSPSAERGSS